jgi:hypothetical protein
MFLDYILEIIIVSSLGVIIYVLGRALPRVSDETEEAPSKLSIKVKAFFSSLPLHKFDAFISSLTEKFLRRCRVVVLKLENMVSAGIHKLRNGKNGSISEEKSTGNLFDKK